MIKVEEMKVPSEVYIEKFDIKVRPYLTYAEKVSIVTEMLEAKEAMLQELSLMLNVLKICTDIPDEYLTPPIDEEDDETEFLGFDLIVQSGLWESVSEILEDDIVKIWEYVNDEEDGFKALSNFIKDYLIDNVESIVDKIIDIANNMPQGNEWNNLINDLPTKLSESLEIIKEDGNADIIKGIKELNEKSD